MNKNIKILIIFLITITGFFIASTYFMEEKRDTVEVQPIDIEKNVNKEIEVIPEAKQEKILERNKEEVLIIGDNVSLLALGKSYQVKVKENSTVFEAMKALQENKENNFSFKTKDYSDLGSFVYEINGVEGTPGKYWLYYVNNKKATLGVSKNILKDGDTVEWKQEVF